MSHKTRSFHSLPGFSLMEMTLVLLVLSILSAVGLNLYQDRDRSTKIEQTNRRIARIEEALMHYRYAFHRLPCPADGTLSASDSNFGMEASFPGSCIGGAVEANSENNGVVAGVVPVRALNLTDDYLYDAWSRKITYVVDQQMTELNVILRTAASDATVGNIIVQDATGSERTARAVYALISHGATGHGAFLSSGQRRNAHITNADKLKNAGVDEDFNDAFTNELVMRRQSVNDSDHADTYDDIVTYKELWNLYTATDRFTAQPVASECGTPPVALPYTGPDVLMNTGYSAPPHVVGFNVTSSAMTPYTDPIFVTGDAPADYVYHMDFSSDNYYLAVCSPSSPYLQTYIWTPMGFLKLPEPDVSPPTPGDPDYGCRARWSPDGCYLAVATSTGDDKRLMIYKHDKTTQTLTWMDPSDGVGPDVLEFDQGATDVAWHPSGDYLAVAGWFWSNYGLYRREGDAFIDLTFESSPYVGMCNIHNGESYCAPPCNIGCKTYEDDSSVGGRPPGGTWTVRWSSDGGRLIFAVSSPERNASHIYYFNSAGPTYLTENYRYALDTGDWSGIAAEFSHDMEYVLEGSYDGWKLYRWDSALGRYVYKSDSDSGTGCNFHNHSYDFSFSADDKYVAFATSYNDDFYIGVMDYATDEINCLSSPASEETFTDAVAFKK